LLHLHGVLSHFLLLLLLLMPCNVMQFQGRVVRYCLPDAISVMCSPADARFPYIA